METLRRGEIGQGINLSLLRPPLAAIADDPEMGGTPGHVSIAPVNSAGEVDQQLLEEWAASRDTGAPHALTQLVLDAIVENNVRGSR